MYVLIEYLVELIGCTIVIQLPWCSAQMHLNAQCLFLSLSLHLLMWDLHLDRAHWCFCSISLISCNCPVVSKEFFIMDHMCIDKVGLVLIMKNWYWCPNASVVSDITVCMYVCKMICDVMYLVWPYKYIYIFMHSDGQS